MMVILKKNVDFYFVEDGGLVKTSDIRLNLVGYTTLGSKWESGCTMETLFVSNKEFTDYHMSSVTLTFPCYFQK